MRSLSLLMRVVLSITALFAVVMACDNGGDVPNKPPAPPTFTPDPSSKVALNSTLFQTSQGITIQVTGSDGYSPPAPLPTLGITCDPTIVFAAKSPTTLNTQEAGAVLSYMTQVPLNDHEVPAPTAGDPIPSELRWVAGGRTYCAARLEITNNTGRDISLVSVQMREVAEPVVNTYGYALVDICSVRPSDGNCVGGPSSGPDDVYIASVTMGAGGNGMEYGGQINTTDWADPTMYPPTLVVPNGASRAVDATINPPVNSPGMIYTVVPELTYQDSDQHTITFSGLRSTLVFSTAQQDSCYGIQGGQVVPDAQIQYSRGMSPDCV